MGFYNRKLLKYLEKPKAPAPRTRRYDEHEINPKIPQALAPTKGLSQRNFFFFNENFIVFTTNPPIVIQP
ncbi:hypothetical protein CH558_004660 [Haemophilus influenzae]|nr:hypothetical protein [Haemophilus influenzae]MCK9642674.1 hypothetical protein [Haemophilus influenzae]